jgi:hypothetical protein
MAIEIASWADLGYRKLGPLPASGGGLSPAEIAGQLTSQGDYESTSDCWVRRRARRKGVRLPASIEIVTALDRDTILDNDRLAFVDRHAQSTWTKFESQGRQFRAEFDVLADVVQTAETG